MVESVTAGRELRFRWWSDDGSEPESEVRYTLDDVPEGTRLTVTERPSDAPATACARAGSDPWDLRITGLWLQAVDRIPATV